MKKKLFYVFLLLLVGLGITYLVRYQMGTCICKSIPKDAVAAVLINARNIEKHFLHDVLTNPMSYLRSDDRPANDEKTKAPKAPTAKNSKPSPPSLLECIQVPKFALLYNQKGSWTSSQISIKDKEKLITYLNLNGYKSANNDNVYSKDNINVVLDAGKLQLIYSSEKVPSTNITKSNNEFLEHGNEMFEALLAGDSDMVYADQNGQHINLSFDSGTINIDGLYEFDILKPSTRVLADKSMGEISALLDVEALSNQLSTSQKKAFSNYSKLNLDSLALTWNGSVNAALHDFSTTVDTVVTFDYDDDFNKVEKRTVSSSTVADFGIMMGMDSIGMNYLKRKKAIVPENGKDVLAIMPLVKTYCQQEEGNLKLFSSSKHVETKLSDQKLNLSIDAAGITSSKADLASMGNAAIFKNIKKISGSISNENIISIRIATEGDRNALIQLFK